jgi:hypothetical protein
VAHTARSVLVGLRDSEIPQPETAAGLTAASHAHRIHDPSLSSQSS